MDRTTATQLADETLQARLRSGDPELFRDLRGADGRIDAAEAALRAMALRSHLIEELMATK